MQIDIFFPVILRYRIRRRPDRRTNGMKIAKSFVNDPKHANGRTVENSRFIRTYVLVVIFESGGDDNFNLLPPPTEQDNTVFGQN